MDRQGAKTGGVPKHARPCKGMVVGDSYQKMA